MDWLRIGAFQLLILYHVSMAFVPWDYHVKLASIEWMALPMYLTSPWRLSLLFVVSGYASAAMLARAPSPAAFLRNRMLRLGLPLLFGVTVLVTPQPWVQLVTQRHYAHGFGYFLHHDYFSFRVHSGIPLPNWMQLWFVGYLMAYTLVLWAGLLLPMRWREALVETATRFVAGPQLLPLGIAFVWVTRMVLTPGWEDDHTFVTDGSAHANYLGMFLFGVLLRRSARVMVAIADWWRLAAVLGVAGFATLVTLSWVFSPVDPLPDFWLPFLWGARAIETWGAIVALIGLAERFANVDHPKRQMLAEAVFPFYLIHQTIILAVGYWLLGTGLGVPARYAAMLVATVAGCWIFYLAGREVKPLRPLIGLKA